MTPYSPPMIERRLLERVASEYAGRGYRVQVEPSPKLLPLPLRGLRVDLLAHRGDETVMVEVRSPESPPPQDWERLLTAAHELGWRVALHPVSAREAARAMPREQFDQMVMHSHALLDDGAVEAALILAFAAVEASLMAVAAQADLDPSPWSLGRLVRELTAVGALSDVEFRFINDLSTARAVVAHGRAPAVAPAAADVRVLLELARWYQANPGLTADQMTSELEGMPVSGAADVDVRYPGIPALVRDAVLTLLAPRNGN